MKVVLGTIDEYSTMVYVTRIIRKVASSLPRKTMVLETGFVSNGTTVPLSNSLEMLFMATISAKRNMPNAGIVKVTA